MQSPSPVDFDQIKRTVSLSDILSRYVRVPHRDKYRIPCPIHGGEAWNSFSVDDERGLFHCFVCGVGGDVVKLYAKLEGITNIEAGRRLTEEFNVQASGQPRLYEVAWEEVKKWEPKGPLPTIDLPPSQPLNGYRKLSREAIRHFDLRLVPNGVLIPFRDEAGRIVGYAIRQINLEPKYLNSKDFKKSEVVYGLYECREYLMHRRKVIVCEGQFSAMKVWDAGYHNVVATLGAYMSTTQATILANYVSKVTVLYDGDEAGRIGAQKIKETYSSLFKVDIKHLAEGTDPDSGDLGILDDGD